MPELPRRVVLATSNPEKVRQLTAFCRAHRMTPLLRDLRSPKEDATTFIGNARIKAVAACRATNLPCLADDAGVAVAALDGAPGIHTADWAETPTGRDWEHAMRRIHDAIGDGPRDAAFVCAMVLRYPDGSERIAEGRCEGEIVWPPRLPGYGCEPIFRPAGFDTTFSEMDRALYDQISHRHHAFRKLVK